MIPQSVLDGLTAVEMPPVAAAAPAVETIEVDGCRLPVERCGVLVVGSGAAGLRAAVELHRAGCDVLVATMSPFGGTSACSGSDKQTLHTAGTARHGDDFEKLARDLGAGGGMDADTAYIEAVGSVGALSGLQYLGLPLPTDRFGAPLRYRTDHDDVGRATSCGPRTSRLMVKVLAEEALRLGVRFRRRCEAVQLLVQDGQVLGAVAVDREHGANPWGLLVILAARTVMATGGPGELYRDSVYPAHCYGGLGMALEAGAEACHLTECQFGIGTRRQEFPWNLSGTYVQAMPRVFSRDAAGREHDFLGDWYRTTRELSANVFRKGYQWPFHATRMLGFGSSLVDLAIHHESRLGRTVYLDFLRNPEPVPGGRPFDLGDLEPDVQAYLANNQALLPLPIDRLKAMNPLAIELYRMHGHDLARDPLPFNVNHQHLNGGLAVDAWMRTSLPGLYAVGEVAGTHGVTRPGGAALNAGQVGGMRVAAHLRAQGPLAPVEGIPACARAAAQRCLGLVRQQGGAAPAAVRDEIQARMSDHAGFICRVGEVPGALAAATRLRQAVERQGLSVPSPERAAEVFRWRHLSLLSEATLLALDAYIADGGGSRGARAYCAEDGAKVPEARAVECGPWRFREERPAHRAEKLVVRWDGAAWRLDRRGLRPIEDLSAIFFEKDWARYLAGSVFADGFAHR